MVDVRPLIDGKNSLGEGPLWHVAEQKLYWIDSLDRWIFRIDADGRTTMGKFSPGVADFFDKKSRASRQNYTAGRVWRRRPLRNSWFGCQRDRGTAFCRLTRPAR